MILRVTYFAESHLNAFCGSFLDGTSKPITMKPWVPVPLRPWFWIPLVCLMAGGGIAFEVALHFSKKEQGLYISQP